MEGRGRERERERERWMEEEGRGGEGKGREEASSEETHLDSLPRFVGRMRGKTVRRPAKIECGVRFRRRTDRRRDILADEGGMAAFECRELESFGGQWGSSGRERRTHQRGKGGGNRQPSRGTHAWHDLPSMRWPTHSRVRSVMEM